MAAIERSMAAGFRFFHPRDPDSQEVLAIHAMRCYGDVVENYTVRDTHEATACRFRAEDFPDGDPLWQTFGTAEEVITALLELPPPDAPEAPNTTCKRSSSLWVPGAP